MRTALAAFALLALAGCSDPAPSGSPLQPSGTLLPGPAGAYQALLAHSLDACGVPDRCGPNGLNIYLSGLTQVEWPSTVQLDISAAKAAATAVLRDTADETARAQLVSADVKLRLDFGLSIPSGFPAS